MNPVAMCPGVLCMAFNVAVVGLMLPCEARAAEPLRVQHLWEIDPKLDIQWTMPVVSVVHTSGVTGIESDLSLDRLRAAQWARFAAENNLPVEQGSFEALLKRLRIGEPNPQVRQAIVSAASGLATNDEIVALWKLMSNDPVNSSTVEQALIRLRHPAARSLWRERISGDDFTYQSFLVACEGLAVVGDETDASVLEQLILKDKLPTHLRVAASRSLGELARNSMSSLAAQVLNSNIEQRYLIAANLLFNQPANEAAQILEEIIASGPTAAQGRAYAALCKIARDRGRMLAGTMVKHADNTVRVTALKVLQTFDDVESLDLQVTCIADVNPKVRELVRNHLLAKSTDSPEIRQRIDEIVTFHLAAASWQAIEQAVILSAELDDRSRCDTLLKLLDHPVPEVHVPAAWALRVLADSPGVYAAMFEHARLWTEKIQKPETARTVTGDDQHRIAHLLEALGDRHYEPVEEILQIYVPKNDFKMGYVTRIGAVWAIGKYWKDGDNLRLIEQLADRAADKISMFPEMDAVRFAATLALGWIADPRSRDALILNNEPAPSPIGPATRWALERIDNKKE